MDGVSGIEAAISGHIPTADLISVKAIGRSFDILAKPINPLIPLDCLTGENTVILKTMFVVRPTLYALGLEAHP